MKIKNVKIVVLDGGDKEAEAVRQSLEYMNYDVSMQYIGRPAHFIEVLGGLQQDHYDALIIAGHGKNHQFLMPTLSEKIYAPDEPTTDIGADELATTVKLSNKLIVSLCCTTGHPKLASVFKKGGNTYIAPDGYIDHRAALIFTLLVFYRLMLGHAIESAVKDACLIDEETSQFKLF